MHLLSLIYNAVLISAVEQSDHIYIYTHTSYIHMHILSLFLKVFICLFGWPGLCCCTRAFSGCRAWGLLSSCGTQASHCSCPSHGGAQAPGRPGFTGCCFRAPQSPFLGSSTQAQLWCHPALVAPRHVRSSPQGSNLCPLHRKGDS